MKEIWKIIPQFPYYAASNLGRIKSIERKVRFISKIGNEHWRLKREYIISQHDQGTGYLVADLSIDDERIARTVHSLVIQAFKGLRPPGLDVRHLNGIKKDNRTTNLKYGTKTQNFNDRLRHGTYYSSSSAAKLSILQVKKIKNLRYKKSAKELSILFDVLPRAIENIWSGRSWIYV